MTLLRDALVAALVIATPPSLGCASTETTALHHGGDHDTTTLVNAMNAESQAALTPDAVLAALKDGNSRFASGASTSRDLMSQVGQTKAGQWPHSIVLGCVDSRVPPETVFDQGIGDIFSARVAGNMVTPELIGSIEYAVAVAGSKLVVVMGHTSCGAVKGSCDNIDLGHITSLVKHIQPSVAAVDEATGETCASKNLELVNKVSTHNVFRNVAELRAQSKIVRDLEAAGSIKVIAAMYDVKTGKVAFMPAKVADASHDSDSDSDSDSEHGADHSH
jgi:carbonic anhydrase